MEVTPKPDPNYQHAKWFKRKYINFLPFVIRKFYRGFDKNYLEDNDYDYPIFNEVKIKKKFTSNRSDALFHIIMCLLIAIGAGIVLPCLNPKEGVAWYNIIKNQNFITLMLSLPFLIAIIPNLIRYFKSPNFKYIIFDRANSTLIMPKYNAWHYFSIPFHQLRATIRINHIGAYHLHFFNDTHTPRPWRNENLTMDLYGLYAQTIDSWSFYVWYMDKNRPLPPGSAFDEFRQADFERRKAEGFPPPLFKSESATPEATPEQQRMREAYWKDEDYFANNEEAFFKLMGKNPYKKKKAS